MNLRFLLREIVQSRKQAVIFVLCVLVAVTTLIALQSFRRDVNRLVHGDAQALHGGDVLVESHYEIGEKLLRGIADLQHEGIVAVRSWDLYSVVRNSQEETLFCQLRIVENGYPLYGDVLLESGAGLADRLQEGQVVVARSVLDRLNVQVGDRLHIGNAALVISDVVVRESARPVDLFNLGPRVFVSSRDLAKTDLVQQGSRVTYGIQLKAPTLTDTEALATRIRDLVGSGAEKIDTADSARSGVKRFFDNLLFFLSLISIFTLILAGIGMYSSITAFFREKEVTLGIIRALGAGQDFVFRHYLMIILILGATGSVLASGVGILLKHGLLLIFPGLFAGRHIPAVAVTDIGEGLAIGLIATLLFSTLPLIRTQDIKPAAMLHRQSAVQPRGTSFYLVCGCGIAFLTLLVIRQLADVTTGIYFMLGCGLLVLLVWLAVRVILSTLRRCRFAELALRQSVRSLLRPGNATASILVTLVSALSVLTVIILVQKNLHRNFIDSYPADAPNLFVLNIQKNQQDDFVRKAGKVELYPVIRGRLLAVNDTPVNAYKEQRKRGDSLAREFNLTYRNHLLDDEQIREGKDLFRTEAGERIPLQVSILDTVEDMGRMKIGDILHFNIQGVPLDAEVTSIRSRTKSKLHPFFYFVFPEEYLRAAPQSTFAALHLEKDSIAAFEKEAIRQWPNLSFINVTETAAELGIVMKRLSLIVNLFAFFALAAGILILVSSLFATRLARLAEAVYYTVLGAPAGFIRRVFACEHLLLAFTGCVLAAILAECAGWCICSYYLDIPFFAELPAVLTLYGAMTGGIVVLGTLSTLALTREQPADFLREHVER